MITLRTILCPVDFSDATSRQVATAADLARLTGARLVLHHNMASLGAGAGVGWMWSAEQPPLSHEAVGQRLEALAGTSASGLPVELRITEGPASASVLAVGEATNADLVVLSTHHASTEDHTSVTATVLERARRAVLALHDARQESRALSFDGNGSRQVALVPSDLTPESRAAVDFAFELARSLPLDLHLLHLVGQGGVGGRHHPNAQEAEEGLRALVPGELRDHTHVHVRQDAPTHGIVQTAAELGASCIVMGEHTRSAVRRWFTTDTSRGVLHDAPCPVWYVPGLQA
jgi:nucleotide-binding universal stress UspA family protein